MYSLKMDTFDNKKMNVSVWDDVAEQVGVVVISHGMSEHTARYDDFARYLNAYGYVVLADDHRGHKYNNAGDKGVVIGDSFNQTINDINTVVDYAAEKYATGNVILFGHSYGSFLSQRYIELYSDKLTKCVLSGTAFNSKAVATLGHIVALSQQIFKKRTDISHFIHNVLFGSYNKPFTEQGQKNAWLSRDKEQVAKYEADEYCGYPLSIGFYDSFFKGMAATHGADVDNVRKGMPIMIAVGGNDPVSNKSKTATILANMYKVRGMQEVELKIYEGARHEILNETNNKEVYEDILKFIQK
ncbi:MAG: alpha/beta hydrolase [Bacillota bacterium]